MSTHPNFGSKMEREWDGWEARESTRMSRGIQRIHEKQQQQKTTFRKHFSLKLIYILVYLYIICAHKNYVDLVFSKQLNGWEWNVALFCRRWILSIANWNVDWDRICPKCACIKYTIQFVSIQFNSILHFISAIHSCSHPFTQNMRCIKSCVCVALGDFHQFLMRDYLT